jgi:hypothetical protein
VTLLNVALWVAGVVLIMFAVFRVRHPYRRMIELDRIADNARRYDRWRGGRSAGADGNETTGADLMRSMLRRRVLVWAVVAAVGGLLIVAGFAIR